MTVAFESGAVGTLEASRIAHGRKMDIGFELTCSRRGASLSRRAGNEIEIYSRAPAQNRLPAHPGQWRRIPPMAPFCRRPAHGLGFNDLKTIEMHEFLLAIAAGRNLDPDLDEAVRIASLCEAVLASSQTGRRIDTPEQDPSP